MKNYHRMLNFTSATTSADECLKAIVHCKDKKDYISAYHIGIRKILHVKYVFSFAGGRMALYSLLQAMNVGTGDEVILQGYTCCVVPKSIMYTGAKPIYADITEEDYNLSYESVKSLITDKTKAIIVQHTYGIACHALWKIRKLCNEKHIYMIEDCAHTFGTKWQGHILGTIGDAAFFSTDHTKYISTSVGGVAVTNNDKIGKKMSEIYDTVAELTKKEQSAIVIQFSLMNLFRNKYISWFLQINMLTRMIEPTIWAILGKLHLVFYMNDYSNTDFPKYTFPAKLSNVQAMIGIGQLRKLKGNIKCRKKLTEIYKKKLGDNFFIPADCTSVLRLPLVVDNPEEIIAGMRGLVKVERWFSPAIVCISEDEFSQFGYDKKSCPNAQKVSEHIVNLPVHPKLAMSEVNEICDQLLLLIQRRNT